jgi:hypothetical protein
VWQSALSVVQPETLILFAQPSAFDNLKALLTHVGGLLKYALQHKQGMVSASEFAALTGHAEQTIRICLKWFDANSEVKVSGVSEDVYQLTLGDKPSSPENRYAQQLQRLMTETNTYRKFWRNQQF